MTMLSFRSHLVLVLVLFLPKDSPVAFAAAAVAGSDKKTETKETEQYGISNANNQFEEDGVEFLHFVAYNKTMTCSADEHARPFNNQIRGVNLGGWMVLEPWITPTLFYQFLGGDEKSTAFDMYTFCQVLGPAEANRQLRNHWETWVTADIIADLAQSEAVNSLRLPVGDFIFRPYGPYVGCTDGALGYVDRLLDWAYSHGLTVLIDIHTMKDSQNGFDNSGRTMGFQWTSDLSSEFAGLTTFEHWPIRTAEWMGTFHPENRTYTNIKYDNIQHSLDVIREIVHRYSGHPAVLGLEPVNEPWQYTPIDILKRFYWEGYLIVKGRAPYWKYIMHDSFRFDTNVWGGFMHGCPERALDTHVYQAWRDPDSRIGFYSDACNRKSPIADMEREFGPVVVGEWSLATDNCAMWLNGFNDNLPGFPRLPCKFTPCGTGKPYMGDGQPGTPLDPSKGLQGPYGTGMSGPSFGFCPGSRDWLKESSGNPLTGRDWIHAPPQAPKHLDDTDDVMSQLAIKKINAFAGAGHGFYFWNFRTDLDEPQWSYMAAVDRGWIPRGNLMYDKRIITACDREDRGEFKCVLKRGQVDKAIRKAVEYIYKFNNATHTKEARQVLNMTGQDLEDAAGPLISSYFEEYRLSGATCDFGGVAILLERNKTLADGQTNDEYYEVYHIDNGPATWKLILAGIFTGILGALVGFVVAMRHNKGFNKKVRHTKLFKPLASSRNSLVLSAFNLPALEGDEELDRLIQKDNHEASETGSHGPIQF